MPANGFSAPPDGKTSGGLFLSPRLIGNNLAAPPGSTEISALGKIPSEKMPDANRLKIPKNKPMPTEDLSKRALTPQNAPAITSS